MGSRKARVLPEPVGAMPIRSRFCRMQGIACICIGVRVEYREFMAYCRWSGMGWVEYKEASVPMQSGGFSPSTWIRNSERGFELFGSGGMKRAFFLGAASLNRLMSEPKRFLLKVRLSAISSNESISNL